MATPGFVKVQPDSTGKIIDTVELVVGANTVERQVVVLGDPTSATGYAPVTPNGLVTQTSPPKQRLAFYASGQNGNGTEALVAMTQTVNGSVIANGVSSYTVPAGKTLRFTLMRFQSRGGNTGFSILRLRSGNTTSSPIEIEVYQQVTSNTAATSGLDILTFKDEQEYVAGTVIALSQVTNSTGNGYDFLLVGYLF